MSPGIRLLFLVTGGWVALRSLTPLSALLPARSEAAAPAAGGAYIPAIQPTRLAGGDPALDPAAGLAPYPPAAVAPNDAAAYPGGAYAPASGYAPAYPAPQPRAYAVPYPVPVPVPARAPAYDPAPPPVATSAEGWTVPDPRPVQMAYARPAGWPQLGQWPLSTIPGNAGQAPAGQSTVADAAIDASVVDGEDAAAAALAAAARRDVTQLAMWAMMRDRTGGKTGLASGGTLGASQAGFRLTRRLAPWLFANLRMSGPIDATSKAGEVALGVGLRPFAGIPINIVAERRQRIGRYGGSSAFALLAEGGVWQRRLPLGLRYDAYGQLGMVGINSRRWFIDGSATVSRPVMKKFALGAGIWGGAQPGLARLDIGPRVSMRVNPRMALHLDYRRQVAGHARPRSGVTVTLAGDF